MWDTTRQEQLNDLRRREEKGVLTEGECQTLECLLHELEQEEWTSLGPALARLSREQEQLQKESGRLRTQNAVLATLAERQGDLLRRAKAQLAGLLSEHEVLKAEYENVTGRPLMTSLP